MTLQYYISSWVILEYIGIPEYPESIGVWDVTNVKWPPYAPIPNRIDVNPNGTALLQYDSLYRVILINELTPGALLTWSSDNDNTTLEICFEQSRKYTLRFILNDSTGLYHLDQVNGVKIQYGGITYTQWMRETPILLIRMEENISRTLGFLTAGGQDVPQTGTLKYTATGRVPSVIPPAGNAPPAVPPADAEPDAVPATPSDADGGE
jgi:hypothetical protein